MADANQSVSKSTKYIELYAHWESNTTYYTITVKDVVGNSSGHLLGSGTYLVEEGKSANASTLMNNATYKGYTYDSEDAEISSVSADVTI